LGQQHLGQLELAVNLCSKKENTMTTITKILIAAMLIFLGVSAVVAHGFVPFSFKAGDPIKADEVNANFTALADGLNTLQTSKQNAVTTNPCADGQFVTSVNGDGTLNCGIDQIGSAGSSGVSSLNGKTGSLTIEGTDGITVNTSDDGKVVISGSSSEGGSDFSPQATLTFPFSKTINNANPAFAITNNGGIALSGSSPNGAGVYAFSGNTGNGVSAYSEKNYGVIAFTNTGIAGIYGEGKINGGTGVRGVNNAGAGSSGVWGESAAGRGVRGNSTTGSGVEGTSTSGYGVKGTVSSSGTGVYGENTSTTTAGAGVQGRANYVNSVGVNGISTQGTGVQGTSNSGIAVRGKTTTGTAGVYGETNRSDGSGVQGVCTNSAFCAGVYGSSTTGVGVWGRNRNTATGAVAMRADGNAVQELGFGGFVKAMVYVDYTQSPPLRRCFNSQTANAAVNVLPCGITVTNPSEGTWDIAFGFDTSSRFAMVSLSGTICRNSTGVANLDYFASTIRVRMTQLAGPNEGLGCNVPFTLIVF
jgi:hypothetical protein